MLFHSQYSNVARKDSLCTEPFGLLVTAPVFLLSGLAPSHQPGSGAGFGIMILWFSPWTQCWLQGIRTVQRQQLLCSSVHALQTHRDFTPEPGPVLCLGLWRSCPYPRPTSTAGLLKGQKTTPTHAHCSTNNDSKGGGVKTQQFLGLSEHPEKFLQLLLLTNYMKAGSELMGNGKHQPCTSTSGSHWLREDEQQ